MKEQIEKELDKLFFRYKHENPSFENIMMIRMVLTDVKEVIKYVYKKQEEKK